VEIAWAGLVVDPGAPPPATPGAPPPPAVALRLRDGRSVALAPAEPPAAWQLLGAIFAARPDLRGPVPPPYGAPGAWAPAPPYGAPMYVYAVPQAKRDDTTLAGLAHLTVFFGGWLAALIIWLVARNTMPYAAKQAKQAFFWQAAFSALLYAAFAVFFFGFFLNGFGSSFFFSPFSGPTPDPSGFPTFFLTILAFEGFVLVIDILVIVFGVIGAVNAFQGKPFHYPLLGRL